MSANLRLGLLVCDHVSPEFTGVAGGYPDMFRRLFARHEAIELIPYDLTSGQFPTTPGECDAWITTGSRRSVYDGEPWIEQLAGLVRAMASSDRPYVGVCFGHQMIAHALGGRVERAAAGWGVGIKEVVVPDPPQWLGVGSFRVLNSHSDQITDLPPGTRVLGGNDHCPVSLITLGETMLGIQGHPEFQPALVAALLRARRGRLIPAEVSDAGLSSLAIPPDTDLLADAIVRYIRTAS